MNDSFLNLISIKKKLVIFFSLYEKQYLTVEDFLRYFNLLKTDKILYDSLHRINLIDLWILFKLKSDEGVDSRLHIYCKYIFKDLTNIGFKLERKGINSREMFNTKSYCIYCVLNITELREI